MLIGINPSSQGFNQVNGWNEAEGTHDIAKRVVRIAREQGLSIKEYWGGDQKTNTKNIAGLRKAIYNAKADGVTHFLSFHTDSAGNKDNDGRGYTGSLLLFMNAHGRTWGREITKVACEVANIPFYASRHRTGLLVLKSFQRIPTALIEIMNHSDPDDRRLLLNSDWRELYAHGLVEGLLKYFGKKYQPEGEIEVSSFQAVPTYQEVRGGILHIWFDGLYTGIAKDSISNFGRGRVFMTVRLDKDNAKGFFAYCIIPKDKKKDIEWNPKKDYITIEADNRPVEVELPKDLGNFSLHIAIGYDAADPRVSVNQMYK